MFGKNKKRAVQVSIVKTDKNDTASDESKILHPETVKLLTEQGKQIVKYVALVAVGAYATAKTIDTLSQIAIKKTKSADEE
jgi:hypothetical protein